MDENCQTIFRLLGESLEEGGDGEWCRKLEAHLARCPRCRIVVDSTRRTIRLYREDEAPCLPASFERHLHELLKVCWKRRAASGA